MRPISFEEQQCNAWLRATEPFNKPEIKTIGELLAEQMRNNEMTKTTYKLKTDPFVTFSYTEGDYTIRLNNTNRLNVDDLRELISVIHTQGKNYLKDAKREEIQREIAGAQLKLTNAQKKLRDLEVR